MNQPIKISLTIIGIALALYTAFIIGKSNPSENKTPLNALVTSTNVTSTSTTNTTPVKKATSKQSVKAVPGSALVQIKYYGGLCLNGKICSTTKMITKDAVYFKDDIRIANINKNDVAKIQKSMNAVNWQLLRSNPKAGCDTTRVQEITYTFYTANGAQSISTCQHNFDITIDPFRTIAITLPQ